MSHHLQELHCTQDASVYSECWWRYDSVPGLTKYNHQTETGILVPWASVSTAEMVNKDWLPKE